MENGTSKKENNKINIVFVVFILILGFFIIGYISDEQTKNISNFPFTTWHRSHCSFCKKIFLCEEGVRMLKIDTKNNNNYQKKIFEPTNIR